MGVCKQSIYSEGCMRKVATDIDEQCEENMPMIMGLLTQQSINYNMKWGGTTINESIAR